MQLQDQLSAMRAESELKLPRELLDLSRTLICRLKAVGIEGQGPRAGDPAPQFELPDATGVRTNLTALCAQGPVVLCFYRGGWCPYCNVELRAYQAQLGELREYGAQLVAISPETPDHSLDTVEKNDSTSPFNRTCARRAVGISTSVDTIYLQS